MERFSNLHQCTFNTLLTLLFYWRKDHYLLNIQKVLLLRRTKLLSSNVNKKKKQVQKFDVRTHVTQKLFEIGVRRIAILKKRIIISVIQADIGFKRTCNMEIFLAHLRHIGAYPGHPVFLQTSRMESFTKIVNN